MAKVKQILKFKSVQNGDYQRIADIFNRRHAMKETVTRTYVRLVLIGKTECDTDKANEIKMIAQRYFEVKEALEKELLSSTEVAA